MSKRLSAAIGHYPATAALLEGRVTGPFALDFDRMPQITRAFAPMVREGRYDVSEMAIATLIMARFHGKPLVLLPVVLAARFQEKALLCLDASPIKGPADLAGKTIAVRAYSQTTGMWLRGRLAEAHGVLAEAQRWITFEDAHVAEFRDPPWVTRAAPGEDLVGLLQSGRADAAIFGNELPDGVPLRPVFPDVAAAGEAFRAAHGFVPVNHLVVMRGDKVVHAPAVVAMLRESGARVETLAALDPALRLAIRYCREQGLIGGPMAPEALWEGLPAELV